jgi:hypothetical protein
LLDNHRRLLLRLGRRLLNNGCRRLVLLATVESGGSQVRIPVGSPFCVPVADHVNDHADDRNRNNGYKRYRPGGKAGVLWSPLSPLCYHLPVFSRRVNYDMSFLLSSFVCIHRFMLSIFKLHHLEMDLASY